MQIQRKWYFELFEFLIVMVILGCMCRIVWIDIYVCFKKKTYKQCSLYLYLVKLKFCADSIRNEDNQTRDRDMPLRVRATASSRRSRAGGVDTEILPPGEGPPPYDLFSVDMSRDRTSSSQAILVTRNGSGTRGSHSELGTGDIVIHLPEEEGPPPYEAIPPMGACAADSHLAMDHNSPPEVLPLCAADSSISGDQNGLPAAGADEAPPPYSAVPTPESQPSQSLLPSNNSKGSHRPKNAHKGSEQSNLRLATISEEFPRDYDPQEGTSSSHVKPQGGANKRTLNLTTRGRPGHRSSRDVEWYHYSVI